MKSHIEKTLSHLYKEHGEYKTIITNGVLLSFERENGELRLFVYSNADYDSYALELDKTDEFPIVVKHIHKPTADKILGFITKEAA